MYYTYTVYTYCTLYIFNIDLHNFYHCRYRLCHQLGHKIIFFSIWQCCHSWYLPKSIVLFQVYKWWNSDSGASVKQYSSQFAIQLFTKPIRHIWMPRNSTWITLSWVKKLKTNDMLTFQCILHKIVLEKHISNGGSHFNYYWTPDKIWNLLHYPEECARNIMMNDQVTLR